MLVKPRQSLISILQNQIHEADGDAQDIMNTQVDQNTTNADPGAGEAESTSDDDLNVDANLDNLDDPATTGDDGNNNNDMDMNLGDDTSGDGNDDSGFGGGDTSSTDVGSSDSGEEVKKGNTDIFTSLTAEEQSIKIMELKRLYNELYIATDDFLDKLNSMTMENIDPRIIVRITSQIEELRRILQDYITDSFPIKTYYENDVNYSIFLSMFTTVRGVFDEISKHNDQNTSKK